MAAVSFTKGVTVSYPVVAGFDKLPTGEAEKILYNELVPACEKKGVKLSANGNNAAGTSICDVEKYTQEKAEHKLFNIERIQKAFASLDEIIQPASYYKAHSYSLKHTVERYQKEYLTNGDLIAAMLLKGHQARFGKKLNEWISTAILRQE